MATLIGYRTGFDALADYVLRVAQQNPSRMKEAVAAGSLGPLVAEALMAMSADVHEPGEQATYRGRAPKLDEDEAKQLLKAAGNNITEAARRGRVSRATLYRALGGKTKGGVAVG